MRRLCQLALLASANTLVRWSTAWATDVQPQASAPAHIHGEYAPAPMYDDPVWHGATDPYVIWMPGKGADGRGEWWMYCTQRRASLKSPKGVDWVHGSAIGIATSSEGLHLNGSQIA